MYNALSDSFINDVINGDAESPAKWGSYALTQVGLGLMGDKGLSKVSKIARGAKFAKVTEVTVPRIQQTVTNLDDNLNIGNRLAFSDTSGLNLIQRQRQ
ncbi:Uncharacterized protein BCB44BAC_04135 [Bacillus cytotoxicus]|uniref:Pre-toxin TG domain-containing protein n=1 Tax=Bacillus cytotoxicus TaxID=580165 RepID=A0AAX2CMV4_9BACI|nr:Uncharacterized protein BCB44BAC_04135 [Bacillus cytotoxicus]